MTEQLTECDERQLLAALHSDEKLPGGLARHVEQCVHCQTRLGELAATNDRWQKAAAAFTEGDPRLQPIDFDASPNEFTRWTGRSVKWNEAMVKELLDPPSHPETLGRLGRYEIERLVGSGGMGIVFKAHDTELNRPVAIKMLAPYLASSASARMRFARESRSAAGIVDDHVVPIHNVESDHQPPFLVMQYVAGGSLQEKLDRQGPLDVVEIVRVGVQTAKALAAAHAQGLIHRDVKPSNILLDEGVERALLTDFGLARAQDEGCLTCSGFHPGTPCFMSPEQVRGETLDGRSDLFSLGCVMYALCTGRPPFRADSGYAVLRRITDDAPRPIREVNPDIPEWLEQVVMKLLEKGCKQRFRSAAEVADILSRWLAHLHRPNVVPAPAMIKPVAKGSLRRRYGWSKCLLAAAASLLLLWAGIVIVLDSGRGAIRIESDVDDVPIRIIRGDQVVERLTVSQSGKSMRVSAGNYVIEFASDVQGLTIDRDVVALKRGETEIARIVRTEKPRERHASDASPVDEIDRARDDRTRTRLPTPFDQLLVDYDQLANLFQLKNVELFGPSEFRTDGLDREVAEETLVFTLETRAPLTGSQIYRLFHNAPQHVRFVSESSQPDQSKVTDEFALICDLRWWKLTPPGPDLPQGAALKVWAHLGRQGNRPASERIIAKNPTKVMIEMTE